VPDYSHQNTSIWLEATLAVEMGYWSVKMRLWIESFSPRLTQRHLALQPHWRVRTIKLRQIDLFQPRALFALAFDSAKPSIITVENNASNICHLFSFSLFSQEVEAQYKPQHSSLNEQ
jgi:hypothetical protein